jgi:hypothetical protein
MVLTHPLLLFGLVLVTIPVILHLLMRAKPKKLVFPALRLIQNRKKTNTRRMRLRHFWLLLLRMAVIALIALAVARPSVPPADYSLHAADWMKLLAVAGICAGVYAGMLSLWKRSRTPQHLFVYRRSMLRTGLAVAALLALVIFVAWPYQRRIAAAITQPTVTADEFIPVAAVMLFDTSLSMQYKHESKTRLEVAQDIAARHIGSMPRGSRVAVCDTAGESQIRFSSDLGGAAKRISGVSVHTINRPLDDRVLAALEAQVADHEQTDSATGSTPDTAGNDGIVREVYVFTDLAASAWRKETSARLLEALDKNPTVNVYLIDVGVLVPTNVAISDLVLSEQTLSAGSLLDLRAVVTATGGEPGERVVELHLEKEPGKMVKVEQQTVKIDPSAAATAAFSPRLPAGPVVQGEIRLVSSDPLAFDDMRSFTVLVQAPSEILVVAEKRGDARYLVDALAPPELVAQDESRYRCKLLTADQFANKDLRGFAVVCLVNVSDPQPAGWKKLADFANAGGGVAIFLGDRVKQIPYWSPAARTVVPGQLTAQLGFNPPEYLDLHNLSHPILKKFADWGVGVLTSVQIQRYWKVDPQEGDAVIARYTDFRHCPAFIEKTLGKGRVLMMTTGIDRRGWNDLPVADWGFPVLADQMMQYLSHASQAVFNYTAGQDVMLAVDPSPRIPAYLLAKPGLQQLRNDIPPGTTNMLVPEVDQLGNYRVTGIDTDAKYERGFSVNADADESRLDRLSKDELDAHLRAERYGMARDIENLQRVVKTGRLGREAFPMIILVLLLVFVGEHFVANRFYDAEKGAETEGEARKAA